MVNVRVQCTGMVILAFDVDFGDFMLWLGSPVPQSEFCREHTEAGKEKEITSDDEPVAYWTRRAETTRLTSSTGCVKEFNSMKGHITGIFVAARPCEGKVGLRFDYCIYGTACHLEQSAVLNAPFMGGTVFVIDRFHEVNHKPTNFRAEQYSELAGVNSEVCEQVFKYARGPHKL